MLDSAQGNPIRTLQDLEALIGTFETVRLEFKDSRTMWSDDGAPLRKEIYLPKLSKEISGLANTEGGHLIVGMRTEKHSGQPDKAVALDDGLPFSAFSPDRLQRQLDASISPAVHGLRCFPIPVSAGGDNYYLVIAVPRSHTAHQADDRHYYGRSEVETKPLHDVVVRALMNRADRPRGAVIMSDVNFAKEPGGEIVVSCALHLKNEGEIDIREAKLLVTIPNVPEQLWIRGASEEMKRLLAGGGTYWFSAASAKAAALTQAPACLFPGDRWLVARLEFSYNWLEAGLNTEQHRLKRANEYVAALEDLHEDRRAALLRKLQEEYLTKPVRKEFRLAWNLYLSNTMPRSGAIDLQPLVMGSPAVSS